MPVTTSSFFVLFINYHYLYTIKMKSMKSIRLLLISVFLFLPMLMNADELDRKRIGFNVNEVSVGAGFTNDGHHLKPVVSASYLFGRHFDENWFAGLSASCAYSSFYAGYIYAGERVYDDSFGIRLLMNGRYHFLANKRSPFVGVDLGSAYIPGYSKNMLPFAGAQLGVRWILKTHYVLGFHVEPAISTKGYNELLFKMTFEFN